MGALFSCGSCSESDLAWATIVKKLVKILKIRRLWHVLGMHLRRFNNLQLPDAKK